MSAVTAVTKRSYSTPPTGSIMAPRNREATGKRVGIESGSTVRAVSGDAFLDGDLEGLFHLEVLVFQLGGIVAGRHKPLGIVATVFGAKIFRDPQVPIQPREAGRGDLFKLGDRLIAS